MTNLFKTCNIKVIDGDNRLGSVNSILAEKLNELINNGMSFYGIQIFHYATVHYSTRHNRYALKFLNALLNSGSSITMEHNNLKLSNREDSELQRDSSEIISVGLANMFICKWFEVPINRISNIKNRGKRCDFVFPFHNQVIVYEVKGRKVKSKLKEAQNDIILKKKYQNGDEKYGILCFLPRNNENIELTVIDPPLSNEDIKSEEYYVLKHYLEIIRISGLFILAEKLEERIIHYESNGEWINSPIEYDQKILKIVNVITYSNRRYYALRGNYENYSNNNKNNIMFAIDEKIVDLIEKWNIDELLDFKGYSGVDEIAKMSFLEDGSMLAII